MEEEEEEKSRIKRRSEDGVDHRRSIGSNQTKSISQKKRKQIKIDFLKLDGQIVAIPRRRRCRNALDDGRAPNCGGEKKKNSAPLFISTSSAKKKTPSESASALQPAVSNPSVARIPPSGATSEMKHKNKEKTNKNETLAVATPETALGVATPRERPISFESQSARRRCRDRRPVDITTRRGGFNYRPRL